MCSYRVSVKLPSTLFSLIHIVKMEVYSIWWQGENWLQDIIHMQLKRCGAYSEFLSIYNFLNNNQNPSSYRQGGVVQLAMCLGSEGQALASPSALPVVYLWAELRPGKEGGGRGVKVNYGFSWINNILFLKVKSKSIWKNVNICQILMIVDVSVYTVFCPETWGYLVSLEAWTLIISNHPADH